MSQIEPTVVVVDDDQAVLKVVTTYLRSVGYRTRGFSSGEDLLSSLDWSPSIDCIVSDLRLRGADGLSLIEMLRRQGCLAPVIIITGHGDIALAVKAMKAGAQDFIEKPFQPSQLEEAVRLAVKHARSMMSRAEEITAARQRMARLSERQLEIVDLIVAGLTSKEIGHKLGTSHRTIEAHRTSIFDKLEISSLAELVRMSINADVA